MPNCGHNGILYPSTLALQFIIPHFSPFFHRFASLNCYHFCKHFMNKRENAQNTFDTTVFLLYNMVVTSNAADSE